MQVFVEHRTKFDSTSLCVNDKMEKRAQKNMNREKNMTGLGTPLSSTHQL